MNFEIQKEHLAERCEVCHQSDQFDAIDNLCNRCGTMIMSQPKSIVDESTMTTAAVSRDNLVPKDWPYDPVNSFIYFLVFIMLIVIAIRIAVGHPLV